MIKPTDFEFGKVSLTSVPKRVFLMEQAKPGRKKKPKPPETPKPLKLAPEAEVAAAPKVRKSSKRKPAKPRYDPTKPLPKLARLRRGWHT